MNTRLLRIAERRSKGLRSFQGLGQLQPVLMGWERGGLTLRIEGTDSQGNACWRILPLPRYRAEAKAAIAELEACRREGRSSPARAAWDAYKEARDRV